MSAKRSYFVAHVFDKASIEDLRKAIADAFGDYDVEPVYADQQLIDGHILTDKIFPDINRSAFGLYEISNHMKPNVFIELGYAKGRSKRCVLLIRAGVEPPSDLAGFDRIVYASYANLTEQLKRFASQLLQELGVSGTPKEYSLRDLTYILSKHEATIIHYYSHIEAYHAEDDPHQAKRQLFEKATARQKETVGKVAAWLAQQPTSLPFEVAKDDLGLRFEGGQIRAKINESASSNYGKVEVEIHGAIEILTTSPLEPREFFGTFGSSPYAIEYLFDVAVDIDHLRKLASEKNLGIAEILSTRLTYKLDARGEHLIRVGITAGKTSLWYGNRAKYLWIDKTYPSAPEALGYIFGTGDWRMENRQEET